MLFLSNFESKKGYIVLAKIGKFFTKMIWFITILFVILGFVKVYYYHYKPQQQSQLDHQGLDVKSGEAFKKQFKELEQFTEEREKAKKTQKQPIEKRKPEANNSVKPKNMLLKRFNESYNFDGA